jgi:molybdate transport system substrate-binding protein
MPRCRAHPRCLIAVLAALALVACTGAEGDIRRTELSDDVAGTVTVLAAASLTDALGEIAAAFEDEYPGSRVVLSFGGSSSLAQQVLSGAPADVLVTASPKTMALVTDAGAVRREPVAFARNRLQIAVPAGNPAGVDGLEDFADPDLVIALCAQEVPCGATAQRVLAAAGVVPGADTLERDVRAVLVKVRLGEVDAGLVYRTDVLAAAGDVEGIDVPESADAWTQYLVARIEDGPNPVAARAFTAFLEVPAAQRVLTEAGFDVPGYATP